MGDKMKLYTRTRKWKGVLEITSVKENSREFGGFKERKTSQEIGKNSGDIGRLTEIKSSQEIEQNSGEMSGFTENKSSQEIGHYSEEMGGLTESKSSQEIGENYGETGDLTERKFSQEIGESSEQMGGLTEIKLSQEIGHNCGEMGGLAERKFSQEIGGQMGGLTKSKLSQEIEEIPDAADDSASASFSSVVAVCVEKNSEPAVRWALDTLVSEGGQLTLIYARRPIVAVPTPMGNHLPIALASSDAVAAEMEKVAAQTMNLIRPLQQMCHSQKVQTEITVLEDHNIPRAILKHVSESGINKLVMMSSHPLAKRKPKGNDKDHDRRKLNGVDKGLTSNDMPANIATKPSKSCSVYVISKDKIVSIQRSNSSARDSTSSSEDTFLSREMSGRRVLDPSETTINNINGNQILENNGKDFQGSFRSKPDIGSNLGRLRTGLQHREETCREAIAFEEATVANENGNQNLEINKKDFEGPGISKPDIKNKLEKLKTELQHTETHKEAISFEEAIVTNGNGNQKLEKNKRDFEGPLISKPENKTRLEMLKIERQHTGETYKEAIAFKEAIVASENGSQNPEKNRTSLEVSFISEPDIKSKLERPKIMGKTCKEAVAFEQAIFGKRKGTLRELLKLEDTLPKLWELKNAKDTFVSADKIWKEYSIEEIELATDFFSESLKIGEGGHGPVYKGSLDHTTVAIKVLAIDAAGSTDEFKREIKILSSINHPNVVLLLGTCLERGCLVYEYIENGSLQDHLLHRGGRASLPWYIRFRIASEIASALHFLHTANPNPIVHRDLEPAHILLDHNFVSKVSDVGLSRLIPPPVSFTYTEYKNAVLACTYCYMDPEYVLTGTTSPKSDLYALGIILLQLLAAQPPVGIKEKVQTAIEEGSFKEILDKTAGEWPLEETMEFAKLALECTELLGRERPDLETRVLPELERFKDIANAHAEQYCTF